MASAASNAAAISAASQQAAAMHAGAFNSYTGQLAVSVQENAAANGQWAEGMRVFIRINRICISIMLCQ